MPVPLAHNENKQLWYSFQLAHLCSKSIYIPVIHFHWQVWAVYGETTKRSYDCQM